MLGSAAATTQHLLLVRLGRLAVLECVQRATEAARAATHLQRPTGHTLPPIPQNPAEEVLQQRKACHHHNKPPIMSYQEGARNEW
jgi:hypothetical protein